jgi:3-oxoacyl-[acyl-carrier protein] reductase
VSDPLVRLGSIAPARRIIRRLGLPLPLPQALARADGPWEARPLDGCAVVGGGGAGAALAPPIARALVAAGAEPILVGGAGGSGVDARPFRDLGEAYGRPPRTLDLAAPPAGPRAHGLVFDATGIDTPEGLSALYDFFHPLLPRLAACGRAVVLGRPPARAPSPRAAAARAALEGFVRSLAKEIGRRGATAHLLVVDAGAEARLPSVLRFVLSRRAAFVTGQPIAIDARAAAAAHAGAAGAEPPLVRPLDGKVALVTGAARGIGAATARCLGREGARVICLDRPADDAQAAEVARAAGGELLAVDLGDAGAPAAIAAALRGRPGGDGVDVVVHNAGLTRDKTLANMSADMWSAVLDVNLAAIARVDDAVIGGGLLRDGGRLIALASVTGIAGNVGQTNYAASKAGVAGYVRRRAEDLAPRGITANAVAPGFIETRLTAAMPFVVREAARRLSALGQGGLPADVAEVITFLASPGAVGLTGAVLRVCGGALPGA